MKMVTMNAKHLILPVCLAAILSACGDDKAAEPAKPADQTAAAPAEAQPSEQPAADAPSEEAKPADEMAADADAKAEEPAAEQPAEATADTAAPVEALSIAEGKARYEQTCKACHDTGLLDAPKFGDKAEWQKRLDAKGVDTLHTHAAKGFNKMPAQATGDVGEPEVYAAVNYMLEQAK
ncbi:c-type cytochrome [Moraxella marmotae]|uniref:c-type cytochrome n=1 Tax=Moraxella marmotae TaxID=3344520 RepID=UPI0035F2E441